MPVKIGVFTVLYQDLPLEAALDRIAALGVEAVEISTGNYAPSTHCDLHALLADREAARRFKEGIEGRGLVISGLSQHGNPLHPQEELARATHETWRATVQLAELLEVPFVLAFSGCPGDRAGARYPNWVTCAWPDDYPAILEWQWTQCVLPYWTREAAYAREHGVRIAMEMHPGFVVYNTETLLRLRDAAGPEIGANFDPSHLFWQGAEVVEVIDELGRADALFHVHAKDTYLNAANVRLNGVLDTKPGAAGPPELVAARSWIFRTIGYGQGEQQWREIVSALQANSYDGVVSVEHEDALLSIDEGFAKAVELLQRILPREPAVNVQGTDTG
jgi:sugar phosphate isomerase/epimerase